ncbi:MAG: nitrous oxide-stimulated promoter family protein [Anaerolineae bacterium]|nr:nitrous oxide-stimulated promoter family protein [Anaerolineae bacterium]
MIKPSSRMEREKRTVETMIALYCRGQHAAQHGLCDECNALLAYARQRLEKCPFQEAKTTCTKCPIHCYQPEMRERVRAVMRYAGPRMIYRHPILAILHLLDSRRGVPMRTLGASTRPRRRSQHLDGC